LHLSHAAWIALLRMWHLFQKSHLILMKKNIIMLWYGLLHFLCTCCGSILSLVQFLFSFVPFFMLLYDNEYETRENKNWTRDKIELQHTHWSMSKFSHSFFFRNYSAKYSHTPFQWHSLPVQWIKCNILAPVVQKLDSG